MATSHLEDEGTQDHGEHVDTPSMTQGSPVLETYLTISVDISVERVELTPVVPSIEVMTGVVSECSGGSSFLGSACESKPKKIRTLKKMSLFSSIFRSRGDISKEVKKTEEEEEEVPCTSYSH